MAILIKPTPYPIPRPSEGIKKPLDDVKITLIIYNN